MGAERAGAEVRVLGGVGREPRAGYAGAGWTVTNFVVWNCAAVSKIWVDDSPGAPNTVVADVAVPSLSRAELEARLEKPELTDVGGVPSPRNGIGSENPRGVGTPPTAGAGVARTALQLGAKP